MRVVVYGGRDNYITLQGAKWLHEQLNELKAEDIVHGLAPGIDQCVGFFAWCLGRLEKYRGLLRVTEFPAKWDEYGKSAGPIRNGEMADYADVGIAFPGGVGTQNMTQQLLQRGKRIISAHDDSFSTKDRRKGIELNQEAIKEIKSWR